MNFAVIFVSKSNDIPRLEVSRYNNSAKYTQKYTRSIPVMLIVKIGLLEFHWYAWCLL
jgi:hypothetical protein